MTLAVLPVGADEVAVLENLVQLYIHDFSEFFTGTPRCELGDDGRYRLDRPLAQWLATPGHVALLFRYHDRLAGFAQISGVGDAGAMRRVDEFFVVRKHRRSGVGMAAASMIFDRWPGRWQADVRRRNTGAARFWTRAIAEHPRVIDRICDDCCDAEWDGSVFRFGILPA